MPWHVDPSASRFMAVADPVELWLALSTVKTLRTSKTKPNQNQTKQTGLGTETCMAQCTGTLLIRTEDLSLVLCSQLSGTPVPVDPTPSSDF